MLVNATGPFVTDTIINPYANGLLSGLSFAIKDNIDVKGQITGYGSPGWAETHTPAVVNAVCLEQLLCEGGICNGKTKSDELAYSLLGVNSFYGTPINPKAPDRIPGGSSSGSASAVASGLVDFAIGTDTAGSVRVPASHCGVWGYRPSHGAISVAGVLPLAPSFDTVGVLAQNGQTLEKVIQVLLAENSTGDHAIPSICFIDDVFNLSDEAVLQTTQKIQNEITEKFNTKTTDLSKISDLDVNFSEIFLQLGALLSTEIWNTFGSWVKNNKPKLSSEVTYNFVNHAEAASRKNIQKALSIKKNFQINLNNFLYAGNVLCFPTTVDLAPRLEAITVDFLAGDYIPRVMCVSAISCLSCTPQVTIPLAEANGVPVGLSFIAAYGQDRMLIDFCNKIYQQCVADF